jgi:hypothetical protein
VSNAKRKISNTRTLLTPKGFLIGLLMDHGVSMEDGDEVWDAMQGYCMREMRQADPDSEYPALLFDGSGGAIVGLSKVD